MQYQKYIVKAAGFVLAALVCILSVNKMLMPKYFYNNTWPTTSTYLKFYEMEQDSIDVLFFGSSHAVSSFSPQELYQNYGIRSYNLGCEQQNLLLSYYWLKEALRFQKPKAVVLDTYMLFPYNSSEPLNTAEATTRKAMDYMKWSKVKREAVRDICEIDENQSKMSYYFTNIRFHTRWKNLNEDDFTYSEMKQHENLKGFSALSWPYNNMEYSPFSMEDSLDRADTVPVMQNYLDKIKELCQQEKIELILVKTPTTAANIYKYNTLKDYAAQNNLHYLDFNEKSLYEEIGFQFPLDNADAGHANLWGAVKMTEYLGRFLTEEAGIVPKEDRQWEKSMRYYDAVKKDAELKKETDIYRYLEALKEERYSIFIAVMDEASNSLNQELLQKLKELGLQNSLEGEYRSSYYAVIDRNKVIGEELGAVYGKTGNDTKWKGKVSYYECRNGVRKYLLCDD